MALEPGLHKTVKLHVGEDDTATHFRSGSVAVLATPRLVALCEEAACKAVDPLLPPGRTSVGLRIQMDHVAPVKIGSDIIAEATLEKVEGRRLTFSVKAYGEPGTICAGIITRVVVDADSFLAKIH
ncbi:MAG: thioesterase [Actinobacteria bacterium]|nr:thioesterase [Actinomycetota bacterium]MCL5446776.1 thioesterase [Actinomycetota bacterium]